MCGRYGSIIARPALAAAFPDADFPLTIEPRWNIAPSQPVLAVRREGDRIRGDLLRWGIALPAEPDGRRRELINLRAETASSGGWLARLLDGQRVLLPASHFFEWRGGGRQRRPVAIAHRDGPMAFAGVLGRWADPDTGEVLPAVAILTCAPNRLMSEIHHRMPVVLGREAWPRWLDPGATAADLARLLGPCPDDALEIRPASRLVNDPRNDGPHVMEPDAETTVQGELPL
ncbi:MAG TPA: SOS response-associated peptidase [Candidatus Dormibacteraeota bacterium]|nr:SOS response-associated peptidase [Candidatus Dormibacteraeota bacterium]